jgi:hypothetical protein
MGDVVGRRAGLSLLHYMACEAASALAAEGPGKPRSALDAIEHASRALDLRVRVKVQDANRIELEVLAGPFDPDLAHDFRAALLRGVFQGALSTAAEGKGWGVLVAEATEPMRVTLTRGMP